MKRTLTLSVDQLYRPQPGGIATYVRGLVRGLVALESDAFDILGLAPRAADATSTRDLPLQLRNAPVPLALLVRMWRFWPMGVPRTSSIVHATSMAGPFAGGVPDAVHSVTMHDILWRDEPEATTRAGVRFHEQRLALLRRRDDVRVFTSSPGLADRLVQEGFSRSRLHPVRLGVDDDGVAPASEHDVQRHLRDFGVSGAYTLYAGTREPRKNIERLVVAHRLARTRESRLGPLVLVGPAGWGTVDSGDAIVLGSVDRSLLKGLYRNAAVVAYVPRIEGWGLPPVEALHAGSRVVASTTTPSVATNSHVVLVDPFDIDAIADGLERAVHLGNDPASSAERRESVAHLTWRTSALDHVAGWQ